MTALEIASIEHLLAVCQRIQASGWPPDESGLDLLDALSDAQSDVENLLLAQ